MLDPGRDQPTNPFQFSHGIENKIQPYGSREATNSGFWASKPPQNLKNYRRWNNMEQQFGAESKQVDESGICSPPLWTTSAPRSPQSAENYRQSLSPASRIQAIARGQRELMEMVRNMPESSYELSLKDLVEQPRVEVRQENTLEERNLNNKNVYRREGSSRRVDQTAPAKRNGNIYSGGFYLKMMFPTSLGSNKKKKNEFSGKDSSKVSLRPSVSEESSKDVEKEWWTKSPSASLDSESGGKSIKSGSTKSSGSSSGGSRSNSRRERSVGSCWFFIGKAKSLTQE